MLLLSMEILAKTNKAARIKNGWILLEVCFAVFIVSVCFLGSVRLISVISEVTEISCKNSTSLQAAASGQALIAAALFEDLVVTNWLPMTCELNLPEKGRKTLSTNHFFIHDLPGVGKLVRIDNVFDYSGQLWTNSLYFLSPLCY